jgi:acetyltransferase-like isoleucine patch superfamily enzyme
MSLKEKIKANPRLKRLALRLLVPRNSMRPRIWVRWLVNPLVHKRGKHTRISRRAMMDVLPFNPFAIGSESTIESYAVVNNGMGPVSIGNHTFVGISDVLIGPLTIGNEVIMAQNVVASGLNHSYEDVSTPIWRQPCSTAEIVIEDECWIGANVVITAGVRIGKHAVIAGGSVVTRDIPPYSVAVGNPARVVKTYNFETQSWEKVSESKLVRT